MLGQETTGPGGICFALRTIPVMVGLAETMAARAPGAWLINFTNPAGMVTEAVQQVLGERAVGVCDSPSGLCRRVARAVGRERGDLAFDYFGLNHLGWLKGVRDRDGELLPGLLADDAALDGFEEGRLFGGDWLRSLAMIPNEYLYFFYYASDTVEAFRAQPEARGAFLLEQQRAFYARNGEPPPQALAAWRATRHDRERTYMAEARTARLKKQTKGLDLKGGGAIIRTAAHGAKKSDFEREIKYLFKLYEVLGSRIDESVAPSMVFQEADLPVRVVRDIFSEHFERAIVDDEKQFRRLTSFFTRTAPELVDRVELDEGAKPSLFERYGIDKVIQSTINRRVDLPSGGYLIIDYAEAMTVIDINSGSFVGRGKGARLEDTITKTNLEAAEEVVHQLRLRDIGGIIVIDFIDMARARNRDAVLKTLRTELDKDRTKTYVVEISPLGLVEMTRQNVTEGVREILTKPCPTCHGDGVVLSEETVAIEVERKLRELASTRPEPEAFLIQVNPRVAAILLAGPGQPLLALEEEVGKRFHFDGSEGLPTDHFAVLAEGGRAEIEERSLPFREGEEIHVAIEEPHMYDEDAAVAKLDGYVISVAGAGKLIGQKRLVRIEKVGRSSASASLVDDGNGASAPAPAPTDAGEETMDDDDPEKPKRRRRGSRGGRGRKKPAESASE